MAKLSQESIKAIEQVLLVNADISALFEKRGVSRDDLREVFGLAEKSIELRTVIESMGCQCVRSIDSKVKFICLRCSALDKLAGR